LLKVTIDETNSISSETKPQQVSNTPSSTGSKKRKSRWSSELLTEPQIKNKITINNNPLTSSNIPTNESIQERVNQLYMKDTKAKKLKKKNIIEIIDENDINGEEKKLNTNSITPRNSINNNGLDGMQLLELQKLKEKNAARFQPIQNNAVETSSSFQLAATATTKTFSAITVKQPNGKTIQKKKFNSMSVSLPSNLLAISTTEFSNNSITEFDIESLKIVGTSQKLEKDYLRLTSAPDPSAVRPEGVLRKSIQLLKKKWTNDEVDYVYMCSQLKSIRQDLTVQHIQNGFSFLYNLFTTAFN
jgi:hypothetical protein